MRFTLAQLRKLSLPYRYEEELDLSEELAGFEDILSSSLCHVKGEIHERGFDTYEIEFQIELDLTMACSVTLESVPYHIESTAKELFSTDPSLEAFPIDGQTLDTKEAVLTNVLIAKPMKVVAPGVEFKDEWEEDEEETVNPAFASLKDLL